MYTIQCSIILQINDHSARFLWAINDRCVLALRIKTIYFILFNSVIVYTKMPVVVFNRIRRVKSGICQMLNVLEHCGNPSVDLMYQFYETSSINNTMNVSIC